MVRHTNSRNLYIVILRQGKVYIFWRVHIVEYTYSRIYIQQRLFIIEFTQKRDMRKKGYKYKGVIYMEE